MPIHVVNKRTFKDYGEYIGRPSPLGNPFPMESEEERTTVIKKYKEWFYKRIEEKNPEVIKELNRLRFLAAGEELYLICWCAPKACHGDVIKEYLEKNTMLKVIVAGGRDFSNYKLLEEKLSFYLKDKLPDVEIISGTAKGADSLGERFAREKKIPIKQFPANWEKFGKSAGYKRNAQMAKYADALVAFWDGKSRGTKHMIDLANKQDLKVRVVYY